MLNIKKIKLEKPEPVYDLLNVEGNHNFVCNGAVVSNCTEITLFSDEEHTFSCVLSSLNLSKYDEWKDTDTVFVSTVFLDCVASEFIHKGKYIKGLEKTVRFTEKGRALGLGALGFHSYIQQKMLSFESFETHLLNIEIFKYIREEAEKASKWMAEKWGEPEWCKGYGKRNTHLLAIAPNMCVTEDTKIVLSDQSVIDYKSLISNMGIDYESLISYNILLDDATNINLRYDDTVTVIRDELATNIFANELQIGDVIFYSNKLIAKILNISNKEKQWYCVSNPVKVKTPYGEQTVNKLWYNGISTVYNLTFTRGEEIYNITCTEKHKFLRKDGVWIEAINLVNGDQFDNDWIFTSIIEMEHKVPTFDIEVPNEHCYILESGIISHNSSSVLIGGVSQGIEPIYKNVYVQGSAAGEMNRINPILLELMKQKNIYDDAHINEIISLNGSVQSVDWLNDDEKKVFKTAFEIDQKVIIRLASVRQKYIDQAQSINLFFAADESEEYISQVHQMAFNDPMIKSLYYIRSEAGVQASKGECEACSG